MATCPNCAIEVGWKSATCPNCASRFDTSAAWHPTPDTPEEDRLIRQRIREQREQEQTQAAATLVPLNDAPERSPLIASIPVFCTYAFINIVLMMWWGFGGYNEIAGAAFRHSFVQFLIYFLIAFFCIHIFLFSQHREIRKSATLGFMVPWLIVMLMAMSQGEAYTILIFGAMLACLWFMRIPGEMLASWLHKDSSA